MTMVPPPRGTKLRATKSIFLLLSFVLLLPPLLFTLKFATSYALGASLAVIPILFRYVCHSADGDWSSNLHPLFFIGFLNLLISLHLLVAGASMPIDIRRAFLSMIPLSIILFGGRAFGYILMATCDRVIEVSVRRILYLLGALAIFANFSLHPITEGLFKPVFPFPEPSHFALASLPVLMFEVTKCRGARQKALIFAGLLVSWGLENLTMLAGCLLIAVVCLSLGSVAVLFAIASAVAATLDLSYFISRLSISAESQNLSVLVYAQGWQLISEAMRQSAGWGLGFQQLGIQEFRVEASQAIFALTGGDSNILDGSFTFSKLASEFGLFGIFLSAFYVRLCWLGIRKIRATSLSEAKTDSAVLMSQCIVVMASIDVFVRGTSYFSGTTILLVAAVTTLSIRQKAVT